MIRSARRAATLALGLVLVAGPALAAGNAEAAPSKRATASSVQQATATVKRVAAATMKATVVTTPSGSSKPIRITMSATATRSAVSASSATAKKTVTARGANRTKAKSRAKFLARKAAHRLAKKRATASATARANVKARNAAVAAARTAAIQRAKEAATKRALAVAPGTTPDTDVVSVTPVTAPCGGVMPAKATGGRYTTCSFEDNFSGSSLDTSKWTAWDAQKDAFAIGDECFKPENVSTAGGSLALTATKGTTPINCSKKQRTYRSGLVSTKDKFTQTYGRFEMRAKFPTDAGYVSGFWMLPNNPWSNNYKTYKYGEIDVVENWALHPELAWAHLHYAYTPGNYMGGTSCNVKPDGGYHTYAVDWSPTSMSFIYDNTTCWTTTWKPYAPYAPSGSTAPAPFDQPFYMIINLSVGGSGSTAAQPLSRTPMGKSLQVDWVRAWK